jgi:hypothetical protein
MDSMDVPLLTSAASATWRPMPLPASCTQSLSQAAKFQRVLSTTDVGNVTQARAGGRGHQGSAKERVCAYTMLK